MSLKVSKKMSTSKIDDAIMGFSREGSSGTSRMTPSERLAMIEKAFEEVLNRKPDTRDLNYYKYSSLSEDEIRAELLNGKEHKLLVSNGRKFKQLKSTLNVARTRVKVLESEIKDQESSFKELHSLIKEKNQHIKELREKLKNPFENKCYNMDIKETDEEVFVDNQISKSQKFLDKIISIFN